MFSVVIPVGPGRTGEAALSSLVDAGLGESDEVIVVGDGQSVPLDQWLDKLPLKFAAAPERRGANVARNLGAGMAGNEILCFLDDDDRYAPDCLGRVRAIAAENTDCGTWSLGWTFLSGRTRPDPRPDTISENSICKRNHAGGCSSMIVRKEVFSQAGGFDEAMASMQDWDLWLRLCRINPVFTIREPLVIYNDLPGPRISTDQSARVAGLERLLEKNRERWPKSVVGFHRARLAATRFRGGSAKWTDIFQIHAPIASLWFALKTLGGKRAA